MSYGMLTHHKGLPVLVTGVFTHSFYQGFADRCSHQLEQVVKEAEYGVAIEYIEVRASGAFVHYRRPHGNYTPSLATGVVDIVWEPAKEETHEE